MKEAEPLCETSLLSSTPQTMDCVQHDVVTVMQLGIIYDNVHRSTISCAGLYCPRAGSVASFYKRGDELWIFTEVGGI
jgi:hypothetical protein